MSSTPDTIDFVATQPHYLDHLAPVWQALPPKRRGRFLVAQGMEALASWYGIRELGWAGGAYQPGLVVVAAAMRDTNTVRKYKHVVLLEHGVGQTYADCNLPAFAGGAGRDRVTLFLCPNKRMRNINQAAYPDTTHAIIGSPRMDKLLQVSRDRAELPTNTAFSFHWDSQVCNETTNARGSFGEAVLRVAQSRPSVGHAHPREQALRAWFGSAGVAFLPDFWSVVKTAGVYVCDNSSTMYEWAALDRPVVVINAPQYRRDVQHGLRFWDMADVGVQVEEPEALAYWVEMAWQDPPAVAARRREIVAELFPYLDGRCAYRAAQVLLALD